MATKSPTTPMATTTKKQSVKPGQSSTIPTPADSKKKSLKPGEVAPPLDPNAKKGALKPGEGPEVVDPNATPPAPPPPPPPPPPPVFRPWTRIIRPPWENPPKPPPRQPRWRVFTPKMLKKYKLPAQVEFQDALWTRTMLDITMKKKYPKVVRMYASPVEVTHELHEGPVQVYLQPLAKKMPEYRECQKSQFSSSRPSLL